MASQKVKFCEIKSVTRDKKRAKNKGMMVSSVSDFVILMAFIDKTFVSLKCTFSVVKDNRKLFALPLSI